MSEIRVTTLKDTSGGNSSSTADIYSGRAKAWVNFNGQGTVAIRANFNTNSITDNGTGDYTVNFTNAMSDANYSVTLSANISVGSYRAMGQTQTYTASSVRMQTNNDGNGANVDPAFVCCDVFR
jgi:hypothetical protein